MLAASLVSFLAIVGSALGGTFNEHVPFDGPNPFNVGMSVYVPDQVKPNAPLVVALHMCNGSAKQAYQSYGMQRAADQYGFPVIYPDTPHSNQCWDVTSLATRQHNAGGDSQGIVSMTKFIAKKYNSDPSRIFVTGFSSGGMMTQLLAAVYPDVYAAGVAFSSVAFGCCTVPGDPVDQLCPNCADGYVTHTGPEWAQIVKDAYPDYNGYRPHMAIAHGTVDATINYHNFGESLKEWTSVLGVSATPISTQPNTPNQGWTKTVYGNHDEVEGYSVYNVGHSLFDVPLVTKFFDLSCPPGGSSCFRRTDAPTTAPTTAPTVAPTPAPTNATTPAPSSGAKHWEQCGGNGWTGPTTCIDSTCTKVNDWYSQCL